MLRCHDDVIKWKHFPRYWPFVWGIHRSSVNSTHEGQWRAELWCFLWSSPEPKVEQTMEAHNNYVFHITERRFKKICGGKLWISVLRNYRKCKYIFIFLRNTERVEVVDDIFKCIFFIENYYALIHISLNYVPVCPVTPIQHWFGARDATSHYLKIAWCCDAHICVCRLQCVNSHATRYSHGDMTKAKRLWFPPNGSYLCVLHLILPWIWTRKTFNWQRKNDNTTFGNRSAMYDRYRREVKESEICLKKKKQNKMKRRETGTTIN